MVLMLIKSWILSSTIPAVVAWPALPRSVYRAVRRLEQHQGFSLTFCRGTGQGAGWGLVAFLGCPWAPWSKEEGALPVYPPRVLTFLQSFHPETWRSLLFSESSFLSFPKVCFPLPPSFCSKLCLDFRVLLLLWMGFLRHCIFFLFS